jgi:hypothetical protein
MGNRRGWKLEIGGWMLEVGSQRNFQISNFNFQFIVCLLCCAGCSNPKSSEHDIKFKQYYVQGEQLYIKHCSNCHQVSGTGLGRVYPPLYQSDFMENNFETVICMMKYGHNGEIIVNGKSYIQPMPGIPSLTNIELAEIATYIYNSWGHQRGLIEVSTVGNVMNACPEKR